MLHFGVGITEPFRTIQVSISYFQVLKFEGLCHYNFNNLELLQPSKINEENSTNEVSRTDNSTPTSLEESRDKLEKKLKFTQERCLYWQKIYQK